MNDGPFATFGFILGAGKWWEKVSIPLAFVISAAIGWGGAYAYGGGVEGWVMVGCILTFVAFIFMWMLTYGILGAVFGKAPAKPSD